MSSIAEALVACRDIDVASWRIHGNLCVARSDLGAALSGAPVIHIAVALPLASYGGNPSMADWRLKAARINECGIASGHEETLRGAAALASCVESGTLRRSHRMPPASPKKLPAAERNTLTEKGEGLIKDSRFGREYCSVLFSAVERSYAEA